MAPFVSKLVNYSRRSETLNFRKNSKSTSLNSKDPPVWPQWYETHKKEGMYIDFWYFTHLHSLIGSFKRFWYSKRFWSHFNHKTPGQLDHSYLKYALSISTQILIFNLFSTEQISHSFGNRSLKKVCTREWVAKIPFSISKCTKNMHNFHQFNQK